MANFIHELSTLCLIKKNHVECVRKEKISSVKKFFWWKDEVIKAV